MSNYETPDAMRHDASSLADDARSLVQATADIADVKVTEARKRLESALAAGREAYERVQEKVRDSASAADQCIRENPYPSIGIAFGIGAVLGMLISGRRS